MDTYIQKVLKVSVAQICLTIGYNSIQSIPLELLIDSLHKFLQEFARDLHRHVELFNRTEANLNDVALTLQSLNIGVNDLLEYINQVEPTACNIEIPQLPAKKQSNLNFLKPGSKEVLTRPVHIYEHLPPILRNSCDRSEKLHISNFETSPTSNAGNFTNHTTLCNEIAEESLAKTNGTHVYDANDCDGNVLVSEALAASSPVDARKKTALDATPVPSPATVPSSATREISSVMMTSGGFISPAIEGRIPECNIPDIVDKYFGLDAPETPALTPPNIVQTSTQPVKSTPVSSIQSTINSASQRGFLKNEDSGTLSCANKLYQSVDKKLLKKVKKKSITSMGPPNIGGVGPIMPNDKAQRKRIKMLQKSMTKNVGGVATVNFKSKSGNSFGGSGQQEKFRKKQYKLRQKQFAQKQLETTLSVVPGAEAPPSSGLSTCGGIGKERKKDCFSAPLQVGEKPSTDVLSDSILASDYCHSFKENTYNESVVGTKEVMVNTSVVPLQQTVHPGLSSPQYDDIKLNNEPDRSKLNIFKKISSSRKERVETFVSAASTTQPSASNSVQSEEEVGRITTPSNTTIFSNDQVISLPSGTTITPAPPSGSGRHVYAPPPLTQSGDFSSVVQVDDSGSIPEGSAVLMKRGDLMIHKPKKRGRKPGTKNQPKILGFPTKKGKKLKKTIFGSHSAANLLEPLNLSHGSIANIANIPLGIASTFPLDPDAALRLKKDRKKSKLGKDPNFTRTTGKSGNPRHLAPTKEEFASINQKLMTIDTVLLAAPPFNSSSPSKMPRSNSPSFDVPNSFPSDSDSVTKVKKERRKSKQSKAQKAFNQQCNRTQSSPMPSSLKTSPNICSSRKSPQPYAPNFANVPGVGGLPMFSFFPYTARPGLIPSHNLFSQIPNMQNNGLFMPPLMGFRPLNPPIRSFLKEEREVTPPLLQAGEGNYSKVAPLVPETMKLDFSPPNQNFTATASLSGSKTKNVSITSNISSMTSSVIPTGAQFTTEPITATSAQTSTITHFGDMRKKIEEHSTVISGSSGNAIASLRNTDVTIEVSSDDSLEDSRTKLSNRSTIASTISSNFIQRQSNPCADFSTNESGNVNDSQNSPTERKNHKKFKKLGKQARKCATISGSIEVKNTNRADIDTEVGEGFDDGLSSMLVTTVCEIAKNDEVGATSFSHASYDCQVSPERRKDHKKMKKLPKEGKLKKKKDKKDRNKNKDRGEKVIKGEKSEKRREDRKDKLKKLKKEKKKEKQRSDVDVSNLKFTSSGDGTGISSEISSVVPKLTLKLGQASQSPTHAEGGEVKKFGQKSGLPVLNSAVGKSSGSNNGTLSGREPSPELARISPLVTRPPKPKSGADEPGNSSTVISPVGNMPSTGQLSSGSHQTPSLSASVNLMDSVIDIDSNSGGPTTSTLPASATILGLGINANNNQKIMSPVLNTIAGSGIVGNTINASMHVSNVQYNQHQIPHQIVSSNKQPAAVPLLSETNRPSSYIDAEGNRVWICPACGKVDDGSAMIGCDGCDAWYHWVCVGILVAPNDNEDWYCRVCITKKRGAHSGDRKRKRNKNKKS